jgi:hypothetical protein
MECSDHMLGSSPDVLGAQDEHGSEKCRGSALGLLTRNFVDLLQVSRHI